jgi:hypothetical protein
MNNSHPDRPRLICRLVRRWEMALGPVTGQTSLTARHMCGCGACREFFAEDLSFEQSLRRDAARMKTEPEIGFDQRILRAVMETRPAPRRKVARTFGFSLAAVAAGVAIAFVVLHRPATTNPGEPQIAEVGKNSGKESGGLTAPAAEEGWWTTIDARRTALELAEKNPLQQEIDSVYQDAQTALGFLALNFLPSSENSTAPRPEKQGTPTQG